MCASVGYSGKGPDGTEFGTSNLGALVDGSIDVVIPPVASRKYAAAGDLTLIAYQEESAVIKGRVCIMVFAVATQEEPCALLVPAPPMSLLTVHQDMVDRPVESLVAVVGELPLIVSHP